MNWFYNLKLSTKLLSGFILVALFAGTVGLVGTIKIKQVDDADTALYEQNAKPLGNLAQFAVAFQRTRVNARDVIYAETAEERTRYTTRIDVLSKLMQDALAQYEKGDMSAEDKKLTADIKSDWAAYQPVVKKIAALAAAGKQDEAVKLMKSEGAVVAKAMNDIIDKTIDSNEKDSKAKSDGNTVLANGAVKLMIVLVVAAMLLAVGLGIFISRIIMRQLGVDPKELGEVANRVAVGDLSREITLKSGDSSSVMAAMKKMVDTIKALVADAALLSEAAVAGRLSTRADAGKHQGDFQKIVVGVNETLDSVIGPLNVAAEYVDRISKGDIPPKITDSYNGDFNEIKNNLNVLVEAMNSVTEIATQIALGNLSMEVHERSPQDQLMQALTRMMTQLKTLADVAEQIADGNLTVNVKPASASDAIGNAFVTMVANLREIVGDVGDGSDSIATATKQIATGNADMAQRTESQASSLEEIASSMEELTSTVKQNADNSQQANQLAIDASDVAIKGGNVIKRVVDTMDSISGSSKKIADIISVIDGIAFQTNILALNAAVEAARAGEQGRGFAVVAGEVRNLAQRSAAAAKEIKELISDSVDKVGNGSKLVGEAGQTMQEIVSSIKRVTDIMAEISAASIEQSSGIEQVNTAITSMDETTQQNASVVQQASAAASALDEQARLLVEAVNRFQMADGSGSSRRHKSANNKQTPETSPQAVDQRSKQPHPVKKRPEGFTRKADGAGYGRGQAKAAVFNPPLAKAVGHDTEWSEF